MVGDKVSNLIIKLKNASKAKLATVSFPYTKFSQSILETLKKDGFVKDFSVKSKKGLKAFGTLEIEVAYEEDGSPKIQDVKRVSKLSKRVYVKAGDVKPLRSGYGLTVFSTPKGVMSDKEAKAEHVGGEELFRIW